jgi:hypothetical protein
VFAHTGWRHACIVLGGESFQALTAGLQEALWMPRGVPEEHRTDSLSAAFNNLAEQEELTVGYRELCEHCDLRASRNSPGVSHENGSIESRQGSLKVALDQALLLRGTREFANLEVYCQFIAETVRQVNARCARAWEVERVSLQALSARRTVDFQKVDVRVSKSGLITVKGVLYSVRSRLIGHRLKVGNRATASGRAPTCACGVSLAKLDRFDLLILDDLSYVRRDQAETSVLFKLIAECYERKSIAITANAPFSAWDEVFPDRL